jgi:hypothetical protein
MRADRRGGRETIPEKLSQVRDQRRIEGNMTECGGRGHGCDRKGRTVTCFINLHKTPQGNAATMIAFTDAWSRCHPGGSLD